MELLIWIGFFGVVVDLIFFVVLVVFLIFVVI